MVENKVPMNIETNTHIKNKKARQSKNTHTKKQNGDLEDNY
jgi:hypothetical protein